MSEIVDFPTPEAALHSIIGFAHSNNLTPKQLVDVVIAGWFAHQGLLIPQEDRHTEQMKECIIINRGPRCDVVDWYAAGRKLGGA